MRRKSIRIAVLLLTVAATIMTLGGCTIKYSLSGASISPNAKTFSVAYFPNNAPMVSPQLSTDLTDALKQKFQRQTKLQLVDQDADLSFQGEIIGYNSSPAAVSATEEMALRNKLSVTVRVTFVNRIDTQWSFSNKSFTQYQEYDASLGLTEAEGTVLPTIIEMLIDDIFNAAVANW